MTVVLRHNDALELNRVEYRGSVSLDELLALAEFQAGEQSFLTYDVLNWVMPGTDFLSVDFRALDTLFARYRTIFEPLNFLILRRSAWICDSDVAMPHLRHWLGGRDTKDAMSTDARLFESFEAATEWLILSTAEAATLKSGDGFREVFRLDAPVVAARR